MCVFRTLACLHRTDSGPQTRHIACNIQCLFHAGSTRSRPASLSRFLRKSIITARVEAPRKHRRHLKSSVCRAPANLDKMLNIYTRRGKFVSGKQAAARRQRGVNEERRESITTDPRRSSLRSDRERRSATVPRRPIRATPPCGCA